MSAYMFMVYVALSLEVHVERRSFTGYVLDVRQIVKGMEIIMKDNVLVNAE